MILVFWSIMDLGATKEQMDKFWNKITYNRDSLERGCVRLEDIKKVLDEEYDIRIVE